MKVLQCCYHCHQCSFIISFFIINFLEQCLLVVNLYLKEEVHLHSKVINDSYSLEVNYVALGSQLEVNFVAQDWLQEVNSVSQDSLGEVNYVRQDSLEEVYVKVGPFLLVNLKFVELVLLVLVDLLRVVFKAYLVIVVNCFALTSFSFTLIILELILVFIMAQVVELFKVMEEESIPSFDYLKVQFTQDFTEVEVDLVQVESKQEEVVLTIALVVIIRLIQKELEVVFILLMLYLLPLD